LFSTIFASSDLQFFSALSLVDNMEIPDFSLVDGSDDKSMAKSYAFHLFQSTLDIHSKSTFWFIWREGSKLRLDDLVDPLRRYETEGAIASVLNAIPKDKKECVKWAAELTHS